jgi:secreted trypsin-like serine protease
MFLKAFTNTTLAIAIVATSPSLVVAQEHRRQEEVELQPRIVGGKQAELGEYPYFGKINQRCLLLACHADFFFSIKSFIRSSFYFLLQLP